MAEHPRHLNRAPKLHLAPIASDVGRPQRLHEAAGLISKLLVHGSEFRDLRLHFGIGFDPLTGNLWETENGRSTDDEINLALPGFNSGWKEVIGFANETPGFNKDNLEDFGGKGTYRDPEFVWRDTVAPTSVLFLHTDKLGPKYMDTLLVGSVKNGTIFNFPLDKTRTHLVLSGPLSDKKADTNNETNSIIFGRNFGVITDLQIGPDGNLYVLSNYKRDGTIFKVDAKNNIN